MATSVDAIHKSSGQINPDQMYVKKKSEYNVKIASDKSQHCYISGIFILPSGEAIVADYTNKRVKILDKHYNVLSYFEVSSNPQGICIISTSSQLAISFCQVVISFYNKVHFFDMSNGKLKIYDASSEFKHAILGITYHQGDLYITSGTALYQYALDRSLPLVKDWILKKTLYEDTGGGITVYKFAISPDGDWIYVTNSAHNKLITLTIAGTLLSTFNDHELAGPNDVHVTPKGQVLVCGISSHTVIQVDREGKKKLATLASENDGLRYPVSVCYNTNTDQMSVGLFASNNISVMELK
ncbi:hypothetical protein DPMN_184671 [Dreissena polymorpha]|uniref:Uncharacterized protein n=1 Tax=Dreissena polymorpha TaxID=45954 RepID=A0A9D4DJP1_DREPO|nr:hypothetical protein DPMN_184671 [Dreissena polymorpha]